MASASTSEYDCVEWLDAQAPRSVVYASVGSVVLLNAEEVGEMAHGLASTGMNFAELEEGEGGNEWVTRRPHMSKSLNDRLKQPCPRPGAKNEQF